MTPQEFEYWLLARHPCAPEPHFESVALWFLESMAHPYRKLRLIEGARRWLLWCLDAVDEQCVRIEHLAFSIAYPEEQRQGPPGLLVTYHDCLHIIFYAFDRQGQPCRLIDVPRKAALQVLSGQEE